MNNKTSVDRRSIEFAPGIKRSPSIVDANDTPPQRIEEDGSPTWIVRGANFVVAITRVQPGTRLSRRAQADEYMLFVPPGVLADVEAGEERLTVEPDSLTIIPPGDSEIVARGGGEIFRIFSSRASDLAVESANATVYSGDLGDVAPLREWPEPPGGYRVRTYPLKNVVSGEAFGRIYRSTNLMVNIFEPYEGSRDQTALSPHSHADFEQGSLTMAGCFEHYLRTPWGKDRNAWREDVVVNCGSPSVTIIPAGMIHTTAWFGSQGRMIDIFSPPREDFSRHAGWVRNEEDYPSPTWLENSK
ncbi:cupin domain-containing protein [Paraburkholderia megapolitana]|uniref:hypothetical protein n=1 Tax=Paraburkholderia megapolitana TaxID=420953 RepID=UPI0038BAA8D1